MVEPAPFGETAAGEPEAVHLILFFSSTRSDAASFRKWADELIEILGSSYTIQLVDISIEPEKAIEHRIVATPMGIKQSPGPERRVFGNLTDLDQVIEALDLR
jgi:circadian clock protein KaiB